MILFFRTVSNTGTRGVCQPCGSRRGFHGDYTGYLKDAVGGLSVSMAPCGLGEPRPPRPLPPAPAPPTGGAGGGWGGGPVGAPAATPPPPPLRRRGGAEGRGGGEGSLEGDVLEGGPWDPPAAAGLYFSTLLEADIFQPPAGAVAPRRGAPRCWPIPFSLSVCLWVGGGSWTAPPGPHPASVAALRLRSSRFPSVG